MVCSFLFAGSSVDEKIEIAKKLKEEGNNAFK
jgi:hypothetical protein